MDNSHDAGNLVAAFEADFAQDCPCAFTILTELAGGERAVDLGHIRLEIGDTGIYLGGKGLAHCIAFLRGYAVGMIFLLLFLLVLAVFCGASILVAVVLLFLVLPFLLWPHLKRGKGVRFDPRGDAWRSLCGKARESWPPKG